MFPEHDDAIKWNQFPRNWPFMRKFTGPGEFPAQRSVTRSFDVFFDQCLNKRLSKQPWGWWFETPPGNEQMQLLKSVQVRKQTYFSGEIWLKK